jgi:anti-anti-sigma factor
MDVASQSPEAVLDYCPECGRQVALERSAPKGDLPCPHCGKILWFLRRSQGEVAVLTFLPRSAGDRGTVEQVGHVVAAVGNLRRVVLNLSHLPVVSASFLGMLVRLHLRMEAAQTTLRVCGLRPASENVFKVTNLDKVFEVHADEQAALDSF